jgi:hypothetical protein
VSVGLIELLQLDFLAKVARYEGRIEFCDSSHIVTTLFCLREKKRKPGLIIYNPNVAPRAESKWTPEVGFEPTTFSLGGRRAIHCATQALLLEHSESY